MVPKHWVRLTRNCNNRCIFCLDRDSQDGSTLPVAKIRADLEKGVLAGARRAVLSGGEPTIHPHFHEAIAAAREVGYKEIQVVSNGRMFAYKAFLDRAVEHGLTEITFSVHGHTADLHDLHTRTRGSYLQLLAGLRNALESRRLIVTADIVLTRRNIAHLKRILIQLAGLGVREFDLLYLVPFGDAWRRWRTLFVDFDNPEHSKRLREAIDWTQARGLRLWTNRLPARYLEGVDHLAQEPEKIYDEVRGRRDILGPFLESGKRPPCRDDRCRWCFLEDFCSELERTRLHGLSASNDPPPCLTARPLFDPADGVRYEARTLPSMPGMTLEAFTEYYVRAACRVKSRRCRACEMNDRCRGAAVSFARRHGLGSLSPISRGT